MKLFLILRLPPLVFHVSFQIILKMRMFWHSGLQRFINIYERLRRQDCFKMLQSSKLILQFPRCSVFILRAMSRCRRKLACTNKKYFAIKLRIVAANRKPT